MQQATPSPKRVQAPAPVITIPDGAGFTTDMTKLIAVTVSWWDNAISGAKLNALPPIGESHRLEVTRWHDWDEDEAINWTPILKRLTTKPGQKEIDRDLRPMATNGRTSLLLPLKGPHGLENLRSWAGAVNDLTAGLAWCISNAERFPGRHFGLLALVDIENFTVIYPRNTRYAAYDEGTIAGVRMAEVCEFLPSITPIHERLAQSQAPVKRVAPTPPPEPVPVEPVGVVVPRMRASDLMNDD